jgi:hypothetical protein
MQKSRTQRPSRPLLIRAKTPKAMSVKISNTPAGGLVIQKTTGASRYALHPTGKAYVAEFRRGATDSHSVAAIAVPISERPRVAEVDEQQAIAFAMQAIKALQQEVREMQRRLDKSLDRLQTDSPAEKLG